VVALPGTRVLSECEETADTGGSNGARVRLWKVELQSLADELGIEISVGHLPPGTSKWNKVEHRKHMRYDKCLEKGYPIGSGVIEGACRNLINDRLELTGMRWILQGAESVIRLRAVFINKDWADFWRFRRRSERTRLYGLSSEANNDFYTNELPQAGLRNDAK
jgi:hypothetical protein